MTAPGKREWHPGGSVQPPAKASYPSYSLIPAALWAAAPAGEIFLNFFTKNMDKI
jgi:hypothetical protein